MSEFSVGLRRVPEIAFVDFTVFLGASLLSLILMVFFESKKRAIFVSFAILFLLLRGLSSPTDASVRQLNVGQGDAAVFRTQEGKMGLIDAGPPHALSELDWLRLFGRNKIVLLDTVALTHLDLDHAGGVFELVNFIRIRRVCATGRAWATEGGARLQALLSEKKIEIGLTENGCSGLIYFVSPVFSKKQNLGMAAYAVALKGNRVYVNFGDASKDEERHLRNWRYLESRVASDAQIYFKASHHGSRFSSDHELLKWLHPVEAWISLGLNRYGHPSREALREFEALKIPVRRTDLEGHLVLE